ncbi:hypothetical protein EG68_00100 [Paragonimus skrjabini miyazakii]|uniref:PH domain-containing protein n=1 Tax=Paragonimus skrjabini miyazakii TaxID=59628 RepID=A0A8S9Z6V9_9TREM|nr:hypothetical protein EG68_00100 [Paragonimus skrjabini miyazakii]
MLELATSCAVASYPEQYAFRSWSEATDRLLHHTRLVLHLKGSRAQLPHSWLSCQEAEIVAPTHLPPPEKEQDISKFIESISEEQHEIRTPPTNAVVRLLHGIKRRMSRRLNNGVFARKTNWLEDDRRFGFESISGEIDRSLLNTSTRSSCYLQEMYSLNETMPITVHDSRGGFKTMGINVYMTAAEICQMFDLHVDLLYTQLYETTPDLPGFVHAIEDHEPLMNIVRKWLQTSSNTSTVPRLFLLENLNKYTPLTDVTIVSLFSNRRMTMQSAMPGKIFVPSYVTSGTIWFRSPGKSWQKMFCFLHGSSVFYSLKRKSITARYMRIIVDLSTVDVFCPITPGQRSPFKSPTTEVIVCRPTTCHQLDLNAVTMFACRTPEGRAAWVNGFRVHKFGLARLQSNLQHAVKSAMYPRNHSSETERGTLTPKGYKSYVDSYSIPWGIQPQVRHSITDESSEVVLRTSL